jgi:beta-glucosidase-like glycosyl hydrolase
MTDGLPASAPEKYVVAFVIQGDDVFKVTADNVLQASGNSSDFAFQGIAKLKAATALFQLTSVHKERPDELQQMARELAAEGMRLLARSAANATAPGAQEESSNEIRIA